MSYFIQTRVDLKYGQNAGFNEVLADLKVFLGKHGWTLILGLQPIVGRLTEVIHIWEVESLDAIPAGLGAVFSDPELGKQLARLPDFMVTETMQVMQKTPYSP